MYTKVNSNKSNVKISDSPISQDTHGSSNQLNIIQKQIWNEKIFGFTFMIECQGHENDQQKIKN